MKKIFLVIRREFLTRVKKRTFLIATILTPLLIPALMGGMIYLTIREHQNKEQETVQVLDETRQLTFEDSKSYKFVPVQGDLEQVKKAFNEGDDFGLLYIPAQKQDSLKDMEGLTLYSKKSPSLSVMGSFEDIIEKQLYDKNLQQRGLDPQTLKDLKPQVAIRSVSVDDSGEEKDSSAGIAYGIGYGTSFLIYLFIFIYGAQVMQGVIEEKSSKIVEIIVSSMRPFQLMMGKIVGVASVGLLQFLIWVVLIAGISTAMMGYFGLDAQHMQHMQDISATSSNSAAMSAIQDNPKVMNIVNAAMDIPYAYIVTCFIFYFLGGYLLYGALFAAVGSAVDNISDAQQFTFPITLPLIIAIFGTMSVVLQDPDGTMSFWLSIIPLTSPVAMMARLAFGVPWWQLALSMALLIGGFMFTVWLAGRIYRVGILMHGTKVNYKVLAKWFMQRN